jgi:hypothetical protein
MSQIRITKTTELDKILAELKLFWPLLDETEIIEMAVSKFYFDQINGEEESEYLNEAQSKGITQSRLQIRDGRAKKYANAKKLIEDVESELI